MHAGQLQDNPYAKHCKLAQIQGIHILFAHIDAAY